jgi:hypothetical protein
MVFGGAVPGGLVLVLVERGLGLQADGRRHMCHLFLTICLARTSALSLLRTTLWPKIFFLSLGFPLRCFHHMYICINISHKPGFEHISCGMTK